MPRLAPRLAALLAPLALAGCGGAAATANDLGTADLATCKETCPDEIRADKWCAGVNKAGGRYKVKILSAVPANPTKGDNAWTVQVLDEKNVPMDGVKMAVSPTMPDHGHGTPIVAVVTETGMNHTYVMSPVNLWMPGYWEVEVKIDAGGGDGGLGDGGTPRTDTVILKVCIEG